MNWGIKGLDLTLINNFTMVTGQAFVVDYHEGTEHFHSPL